MATTTLASGRTRYQLIDEDGDELPGTWEFDWEGRDPFEVVIAVVTEVSGRPWKWTARRTHAGRFSPERAKAMCARTGNVLRGSKLHATAAVIARVVRDEFGRRRPIDEAGLIEVLAGRREVSDEELESVPELCAAVMLRTLREALKTARECGGGLRVSWAVE